MEILKGFPRVVGRVEDPVLWSSMLSTSRHFHGALSACSWLCFTLPIDLSNAADKKNDRSYRTPRESAARNTRGIVPLQFNQTDTLTAENSRDKDTLAMPAHIT